MGSSEIYKVPIPTIVRNLLTSFHTDSITEALPDSNISELLRKFQRDAYYINAIVENNTTSLVEDCSISLEFPAFYAEFETGGKLHIINEEISIINIGTLRPKEKTNLKLWHTSWLVSSTDRFLEKFKFLSKTHVKTRITTYILEEMLDSYVYKLNKHWVSGAVEALIFFAKLFGVMIILAIIVFFITKRS